MHLCIDDVIKITKLLDESNFNELSLEIGDLKLIVNKSGSDGSPPVSESIQESKSEPMVLKDAVLPQESIPASQDSSARLESGNFDEKASPLQSSEEEGFIAIKAPMLGVFYRAPKPEDPPFVELGTVVNEEDTVCIIEVMKLFSTISAGVRGRIAKICAENGQLVEYNQVIFMVEPEAI